MFALRKDDVSIGEVFCNAHGIDKGCCFEHALSALCWYHRQRSATCHSHDGAVIVAVGLTNSFGGIQASRSSSLWLTAILRP